MRTNLQNMSLNSLEQYDNTEFQTNHKLDIHR